MYLDAQNRLSQAQALTNASGLADNVIDLKFNREIGTGTPMAVLFTIDVAAAIAATETYRFSVHYSPTDVQTIQKAVGERHFATVPPVGDLDAALLVPGYSFSIALPPSVNTDGGTFLGVSYTLGTGATLTVTANLVPQSFIDSKSDYAKGYVTL